ncbi:hypothetical protein MUP77_14375 [Candidatus Bathyarchaeota archaeon]|nr:hypothetical protein [Candidatus Bathyarchaeota archaeon]
MEKEAVSKNQTLGMRRIDVRFNFRVKIRSWTLFAMLAKTQTLEGVTSLQNDGSHIVMWDLENCCLEKAEETLRTVQSKYGLSHIYIASDLEGSYRAWCFTKVSLKTFLAILLDSLDILDYSFFYYTVKRRKATLRTSSKKDRPQQKVVSVLQSHSAEIPSIMERVVYDTGLEKRGMSLLLGDKDG